MKTICIFLLFAMALAIALGQVTEEPSGSGSGDDFIPPDNGSAYLSGQMYMMLGAAMVALLQLRAN